MANQAAGISVKILNKEFQVTCPQGSESALISAATYLDEKMHAIRESGRVIGVERIAVMAALNMAHELLQQQREKDSDLNMLAEKLQHLQNRINTVVINKVTPEFESSDLSQFDNSCGV